MSKKALAVLATVALGLGGAVLAVAGPASAHVPSISTSCSGVVLSATLYDNTKANTWTATVGGVTSSGTFGSDLSKTIAVPQGGATTAWSATIQAFDGSYKDTQSGNVGPCGVVPKDATAAITVTPATCSAPGAASWTGTANVVTPLPVLDESVGSHTSLAVTAVALHQFSDGTTSKTFPYAIPAEIATQSTNSDAPCYQAPPPPDSVKCPALGTPYFEAPDHFAVKSNAGYSLYNLPLVAGAPAGSTPDGHPVDLIFPTSGNLQGVTSITYPTQDVVGNGVFFRFIVDLSADGGSAYNSISIVGQPVNQSSVANVGSRAALVGKTLTQIEALYPHNQIKAWGIQTGSSYLSGDGALVTGLSETGTTCNVSFVTSTMPPTTPTTPTPLTQVNTGAGSSPFAPFFGSAVLGALALMLGGVFLIRRRQANQ